MAEPIVEARRSQFAVLVGRLIDAHPASITSWWRSAAHNKAVGGMATSFHLEGLGADCLPDAPKPWSEFKQAANALGLDAVDEGDHVHVELDYRRA